MKKYLFKIIILFVASGTLTFSCTKSDSLQLPPPEVETPPDNGDNDKEKSLEDQLKETDWKKEEVAEGIVWKYYHFSDIFKSQQSITVFEIDPKKTSFDIEYVTSGFLKTSEAAMEADAQVAFNGSFFNTSTGGSTVFFKRNGEVINLTRSGFDFFRENSALSIDEGNIDVHKKPSGGWTDLDKSTVLVSGPLLVYNNEEITQVNKDFNTNRHPRTAVGVTSTGKVITVVVDGRSSQSHGLTIDELAELMSALGCVKAMNLDGGGSSTAWVKDEGVVNYPTDNKQFDHEGERGVATVITVID